MAKKIDDEDREEVRTERAVDEDQSAKARLNISALGGRNKMAGTMGGGRIGVSIPVGKDMEIEPYVVGGGSSKFGGKVMEGGVNLVKRFKDGGIVGSGCWMSQDFKK